MRRFWPTALVALALVLAATVSGCATVPSSSSAKSLGTLNRQPSNPAAAPPDLTRDPVLLLQDFLKVSVDPTNQHAAARQYLSREADAKWSDASGVTLLDNHAVLQESSAGTDRMTFLVRAVRVGQLLPSGVYQPEVGDFEARIGFSRVGGEWHIDQLPPGVMVEHREFLAAYKPHPVYFLNPSGTSTVPDLRWIFDTKNQLAQQLINMLSGGPRASLKPAVRNLVGGVVDPGEAARADGRGGPPGIGLGGVKIDFRGASSLDQHNRHLLAAQVMWTLDASGIVGPYAFLADGKPLESRFGSDWPRSDVEALNPNRVLNVNAGLHVVRNGNLISVANNTVSPVPGYFGSATALRVATLSHDAKLIAGVVGSSLGAQLMIGGYAGASASLAVEGATITRPTWSPDNGSVWAVVDGVRVVRAARDHNTGQASLADVDSTAINTLGRPITELRLSRDGVRAALVVDGRVYIATLVVQPDGRFALTNPHPVPLGAHAKAVSLDWADGASVLISQRGVDELLVTAPLDGANTTPFISQNLTPPVGSVTVTVDGDYVEDGRAILQLANKVRPQDRFWREVVPNSGTSRATPVFPG